MSPSDAPPAIGALRDVLLAVGFDETHTKAPETFGNQIIELTSADLSVRVVSDRGEWSVELSPGGDTGWFLAQLWQQCLEGIDIDPYAESVDQAAAFVTERLQQLRALTADERSRRQMLECLIRARAARASEIRRAIFGDDG